MQRVVKYYIDDVKQMIQDYGWSKEEVLELELDYSFKVIFTLIGEDNQVDKYKLTDYEGNKIPLSSINGYERGLLMNCYSHFEKGKENLKGVVKIEESER